MHRCASSDHPHCTHWVLPGETQCAHGHAQPQDRPAAGAASAAADAFETPSYDMIRELRSARGNGAAVRAAVPAPRPHLHVSGYDPRAAGGRHAVKLELRGMPPEAPAEMALLLQSDLLADSGARMAFRRGPGGDWRPLFIEFSSRGREHGQYRIDAEVHAQAFAGDAARAWAATLVLLVPRPDATLGDIHQTFLSTHKNVRIHADDGAITRLQGLAQGPAAGGTLDIDVRARNASIAQLDFAAFRGDNGGGKVSLALPTLAWDEDLVEIDLPAAPSAHPCPASSACLVQTEPDAGFPRHLRLFALDECVLGRFEMAHAEADLLLQHHGEHGPDAGGLTRRLSGRHAVIRATRHGFEIEDVSRYGLLLDGVWPGKHKPVPLRLGLRIDLTASIRGVVTLVVTALLDHALVLHRVDAGGAAECFMLLVPERRPAPPGVEGSGALTLPRAAAMPLLFHRDGGFWHLDQASGRETPLTPASALERLAGFHGRVRFTARPRPEDAHEGERRRTIAAAALNA
ncbi:FHA domain-containing protein [Massilia phyllosphaerae]|uniref:FHA domain-containing protein n=1 Tax=Massilia phyllosphaerae TaxID=3106034 RepID=UPI002B1CC4C7|nr:FHA domain-containing protein [Massilia sp. SGZ-792]